MTRPETKSLIPLTAILAFACLLPAPAVAGREGHGGVSIVCRNRDKSIKSVELLDTFEGNNRYNLKIGGSALPIDDLIEQAQIRLASRPDLLEEFQNELAYVQAHIQFMDKEVGLNPTNDAFPVIKKKRCRYEQLAVYTDDGQILVDSELFEWLSVTDRAALYVHEVIFKMARGRGAESSVESRKLTAYLFTRPNQPGVIKELLESMFPPPAPPAPPAPPSPPQPVHPRAFEEISSGHYQTNNPDVCFFTIYKDNTRGNMTLEWNNMTGRCAITGQIVSLNCSRSYCGGDARGKFIRLYPQSGTLLYMVNDFRALFTR
jgi:hypothetical protein